MLSDWIFELCSIWLIERFLIPNGLCNWVLTVDQCYVERRRTKWAERYSVQRYWMRLDVDRLSTASAKKIAVQRFKSQLIHSYDRCIKRNGRFVKRAKSYAKLLHRKWYLLLVLSSSTDAACFLTGVAGIWIFLSSCLFICYRNAAELMTNKRCAV